MDYEPPRFPTPTPTFLSFGMSRVNFLDLKRSPLEQLRSVRFAVGKRGTGFFNWQMEFLNCVLNFFFDWEWESEFRLTRSSPHSKSCTLVGLKLGVGAGVGVETRRAHTTPYLSLFPEDHSITRIVAVFQH
jgi:hypothetical protein